MEVGMKLRILKLVLAGLAAAAFATVRPALANEDDGRSDDSSSAGKGDDQGETDGSHDGSAHPGDHDGKAHDGDHDGDHDGKGHAGDHGSDGDHGGDAHPGDHGGTGDHADPSTKTLPSHASDNARQHAFGVWGAQQKAAHAAARAAIVKEAHRAAGSASPTLPSQAIAGHAHADGHHDGRPDSPGERGLDNAAAHRSPNAHSRH
jgi:hypothetical protein